MSRPKIIPNNPTHPFLLPLTPAGQPHPEQRAGRHQSDQNRAGRRHPGDPAGDRHDARLPARQHHRLLWLVPAPRQAVDLHGVLRRRQPAGHLPGDGAAQRAADRVHVPRDAAGPRVSALDEQDASRHQGRQHSADGAGRREAGRLWCVRADHGHDQQAAQFHWDAVLDGAGGGGGGSEGRVQPAVRYLGVRHHGDR